MSVTPAPWRAAATAWLKPLPPRNVANSSPSTVSPGRGSRGARATRSVMRLPSTITCPIRPSSTRLYARRSRDAVERGERDDNQAPVVEAHLRRRHEQALRVALLLSEEVRQLTAPATQRARGDAHLRAWHERRVGGQWRRISARRQRQHQLWPQIPAQLCAPRKQRHLP